MGLMDLIRDPIARYNENKVKAYDRHHDLKADYGLVSPEGVFWSCGYADHADTAEKIGIAGNMNGWIHVAGHGWDLYGNGAPTQAQLDTAMDWWQAAPMFRHMPKINNGW